MGEVDKVMATFCIELEGLSEITVLFRSSKLQYNTTTNFLETHNNL
jgi:hypothetical protein